MESGHPHDAEYQGVVFVTAWSDIKSSLRITFDEAVRFRDFWMEWAWSQVSDFDCLSYTPIMKPGYCKIEKEEVVQTKIRHR